MKEIVFFILLGIANFAASILMYIGPLAVFAVIAGVVWVANWIKKS